MFYLIKHQGFYVIILVFYILNIQLTNFEPQVGYQVGYLINSALN